MKIISVVYKFKIQVKFKRPPATSKYVLENKTLKRIYEPKRVQ
jgi:hypothetical protein